MNKVIFVAMRESAVLLAIEKLQSKNTPVTYETIGVCLNCSYATVQRGVSNLIKSNILDRQGTPGTGYTYTIMGRDDAKSA